ncbi:MAG: ATP-binding protein [Gammaproteobacteria bacterium]
MNEMMDALLIYSRIGRMEKEKEEVNIKNIVEKALSRLEADIREKNASITVEGDFPDITCYEERISQVFLELIGNSLKYVPAGGVPEIIIGCKENNGDQLFYVKDNGVGIAENFYPKVFKMFSRLYADESEYKGSGVGLTAAKKIIELHGGEIYLESVVGEGTTFYFTLQEG